MKTQGIISQQKNEKKGNTQNKPLQTTAIKKQELKIIGL